MRSILLVLCSVVWISGCQTVADAVQEGDSEGDCSDGVDNDFDEVADCLDEGCFSHADCVNEPPSEPTISIDPTDPMPGQSLTCVVDTPSEDPESASLDYEFTWSMSVGGSAPATVGAESLASEGEAYPFDTVVAEVTGPAETWTCTVVVSDGELASDAVSASVTTGDACTDLNCDGYPDIVFANLTDDAGNVTPPYLYYGSSAGYSETDRDSLPGAGSADVSIDDLNDDGYMDIVLANYYVGNNFNIDSGIFWGSSTGYSSSNRTGLPTLGGFSNEIADVNGDGYKDILFANLSDGLTYEVNSYLYWGSENGYSSADRFDFEISAGSDVKVGDLNNDGFPDVVFCEYLDTENSSAAAYVFMGAAAGLESTTSIRLDTGGCGGLDIGDLNADGYEDAVFGGYGVNSSGEYVNSIYWGSAQGLSDDNRATFPGLSAYDAHINDFNNDGFLDFVVANLNDPVNFDYEAESYIYWGSATGFDGDNRSSVFTFGASGVTSADLDADGHVDLVFTSLLDGGSLSTHGHIFWGSATGYSDIDYTFLDVYASLGLAIAGGQ